MNEIVEKSEKKLLPTKTIFDDVALELKKEMIKMDELIQMMYKDTYTEEIVDESGKTITRSYPNENLLPWIREKRMFLKDLWKMSGGELQQEKEKEIIKLEGKMIYETINQMSPDELEERFNEWRKLKENDN